jgi:hypothetical protein
MVPEDLARERSACKEIGEERGEVGRESEMR